jgi:hypothetical protein
VCNTKVKLSFVQNKIILNGQERFFFRSRTYSWINQIIAVAAAALTLEHLKIELESVQADGKSEWDRERQKIELLQTSSADCPFDQNVWLEFIDIGNVENSLNSN